MSQRVAILGMGADGPASLSPRAVAAITAATWIAGGRRHLELLGPVAAETFTIADNLDELVDRLRRRGDDEQCVVLASGDPLCFGIGHRLGEALSRDQVEVEPAVSALQLGFARAGLAWHDAAIASIHGRPLAPTLIPLLGLPKIGLFTQDGSSPAAVAQFFLDRGLDDYDVWVGERLGTAAERVVLARLPELIGRRFADLNVLVLHRPAGTEVGPRPMRRGRGPALRDADFAQPEAGPVLLTHADVRALVVARFEGLFEGPIWDIGAGLGGVTVALARAFPASEVVAVERSDDRLDDLRRNRARFGAFNVRVVAGEAPECLLLEEHPAGVFLGGSGHRLDAILDLVLERLAPGGILVANFVGLEHLARALERLRGVDWPTHLTQVQISHGHNLAGLTTLAPQRPVWILRTVHV
jgi:precorrin-6Y C5,15-methyltransferase (decarboxylating)